MVISAPTCSANRRSGLCGGLHSQPGADGALLDSTSDPSRAAGCGLEVPGTGGDRPLVGAVPERHDGGVSSPRELRRPGRAETLLLVASLAAAAVVVTLGLVWGSEADGWQVAVE